MRRGTRRQPNLSEILSTTIQQFAGIDEGQDGDDSSDGGGGAGGNGRVGGAGGAIGGGWNGSYQCPAFKTRRKCDVCSHMEETSFVYSKYFNRKFAIHGHNVHLPAGQKNKLRWFVYCCEDTACELVYIGSTVDVCKRWSSTKKACLDKDSSNTGLYKHFMTGCPADNNDGKLQHLKWTLVDFMDTSEEKLTTAGHVGGPKCRCSECNRLKAIEDKWICRMGSFYGSSGLNTRDEIKSRSRVNFIG